MIFKFFTRLRMHEVNRKSRSKHEPQTRTPKYSNKSCTHTYSQISVLKQTLRTDASTHTHTHTHTHTRSKINALTPTHN